MNDFCAQGWIPVIACFFCMVKLSVSRLIIHESISTCLDRVHYAMVSFHICKSILVDCKSTKLVAAHSCFLHINSSCRARSFSNSFTERCAHGCPCFSHLMCTGGPCRLPGHAFPQMEVVPGANTFGTAVNSISMHFQLHMQDGSSRIRSFSSPIHPQDVNFGSTSSLIVPLKAVYKQPLVLR